jgi:hypothetical protein
VSRPVGGGQPRGFRASLVSAGNLRSPGLSPSDAFGRLGLVSVLVRTSCGHGGARPVVSQAAGILDPMSNGMNLQVRSLEIDERGSGTLTARFERRADYKRAVAGLGYGTLLFDNRGQGHHLRLAHPLPTDPPTFPCEVGLPVLEEPIPPGQPTHLMWFGNNFIQAAGPVQVVDFLPPSSDGGEGRLRAWCDTADEYEQLRRFLDEPHGSALSRMDGSGQQWYVQRIEDDGEGEMPYPKAVTFRLRWRREDT